MIRSRTYLILTMLCLAGFACLLPPALMFGESAFNTSVAQTVSVGLTTHYVSPAPTFSPAPAEPAQPTADLPTATLAPTETFAPTFFSTPTRTYTPSIPLPELSVSVNTNCRAGPGKEYPIEGALLADRMTTAYGVDPTGKYWRIRNPDPGAEYCWISGKYASVMGAISLVPVMTPPPMPTMTLDPQLPAFDFRMTYVGMDGCADWRVEVNLYNAGRVALKSIYLTLKDEYHGISVSGFTNGFINVDECGNQKKVDSLASGAATLVSAPPLTRNPAGRKLSLTATVCAEVELAGNCRTRSIFFTP